MTTAAAAVQTIVGDPHTRRGQRRQVDNVGEKHHHQWSVCILYTCCVASAACPSFVTDKKMVGDIRNKGYNWQIRAVQLLLTLNHNPGL